MTEIKRKKIAIVYPDMTLNRGTQNAIAWLLEKTDHRRFDLHLITLQFDASLWPQLINSITVTIIDTRLFGLFRTRSSFVQSLAMAGQLRKILTPFDVVCAENYPANMWVWQALKRIRKRPRLIYFCQEPSRHLWHRTTDIHEDELYKRYSCPPDHDGFFEKLRKKSRRTLDVKAVQWFDRILCNSEYSRAFIGRIYSVNPAVCYIGIPHTAPQLPERSKRGPVIICIAPLIKEKDPLTALEAFRILYARLDKIKPVLYLIGKGVLEETVSTYISNNLLKESVIRKTYVDDTEKNALLSQSRIGLYFGVDEPFGLTVLEYMQSGVVPIVYDHGGPQEIVLKTGAGFAITTFDAAAAATVMERLILDDTLYQSHAARGAQQVSKLFGMRDYIKIMERMFEPSAEDS